MLSNCITLWKAVASAVGEKLALTAMRREMKRKSAQWRGRRRRRRERAALCQEGRRSQESEAMAIELLARRKS